MQVFCQIKLTLMQELNCRLIHKHIPQTASSQYTSTSPCLAPISFFFLCTQQPTSQMRGSNLRNPRHRKPETAHLTHTHTHQPPISIHNQVRSVSRETTKLRIQINPANPDLGYSPFLFPAILPDLPRYYTHRHAQLLATRSQSNLDLLESSHPTKQMTFVIIRVILEKAYLVLPHVSSGVESLVPRGVGWCLDCGR